MHTEIRFSRIAVPTGDQAGVMEMLGLSQPRPVPFSVGVYAADIDSHGGLDANPLDVYRTVFVTPELAGWTLAVGSWCDPSATERQNGCRVSEPRWRVQAGL